VIKRNEVRIPRKVGERILVGAKVQPATKFLGDSFFRDSMVEGKHSLYIEPTTSKRHEFFAWKELAHVKLDQIGSIWRQELIYSEHEWNSLRAYQGKFSVYQRYREGGRIYQIHRNNHGSGLGTRCTPIDEFYPLVKRGLHENLLAFHDRSLSIHQVSLVTNLSKSENCDSDTNNTNYKKTNIWQILRRKQAYEVGFRLVCGPTFLLLGCVLIYHVDDARGGWRRRFRFCGGTVLVGGGLGAFFLPVYWQDECKPYGRSFPGHQLNVSQKVLTHFYFPYYTKYMANVLSTDKQAGIIGALCEGSSIRSIERMTGVHRDTIMRLGVRVGRGCMELMDETMRGLSCTRLEMDEIWGFVGKKQKNVGIDDDPSMGDVWTFCAIDADTKLVPSFLVGKRDKATANAFLEDISGRMNNRLQISTDGLAAYVDAISEAFGSDVDFAQIIKTYGHQEISNNRRYSAPDFVSSEKVVVIGNPDNDLISTSYVERLNATTRLHMRRLTRLTLAFSKKLDNFEAAVGLHFAYYNFVKKHSTVKCTPAMAAGVATDYWTVADLVRTAA
jgi:IS1 family transposase